MRVWGNFEHNAKHARPAAFNPLDGAGGIRGYARWHNQGRRVLYSSCSPSLALLEVLVRIDPERFIERSSSSSSTTTASASRQGNSFKSFATLQLETPRPPPACTEALG